MRFAFLRADAALVAAPVALVSLAGCALIGPPADVVRDCARVEAVVKSGTRTTGSTVEEGPEAIAARLTVISEKLSEEAATIDDEDLRKAVIQLATAYRETATATTPQRVPDAAAIRAAARGVDGICGT